MSDRDRVSDHVRVRATMFDRETGQAVRVTTIDGEAQLAEVGQVTGINDYEDYAARVRADDARIGAMRDDLIRRIEALDGKPSRVAEMAIHTTEVAIGAFAGGAVEGRTGARIGLGAGIAGVALGIAGAANGHGEHVLGIGQGMLASYVASIGRAVASRRRAARK